MKGRRALGVVIVLGLVCMTGIVGMLLVGGGWDWLFFGMAALPLLFGLWRRTRLRRDWVAAHSGQ